MRPDREKQLRNRADALKSDVDALRAAWKAGDKKAGDKLPEARAKASRALQALWEAFPEEKPSTQRVM